MAFWSQQLAANNGELGAITQAFSTSEEAQQRFGAESVAERISYIYLSLFNRAPEPAGLAYWTNAIAQGHVSLADIAVSILNGAQGTDATLSVLRQRAVAAFTAQIGADGSEYSGYASIEAARILVRAVTLDTSGAGLDALVKAAVSFADTATKTPQVVDAIAVNTTLLALFDTTRGAAEPVELAQALADTAKAAAGDPLTLDSLLRGGGMDKVLKVMSAAATLQDVVDALASGGLPAAVEVVYPTKPTVPAPEFSLTFAFESVSQGALDTHNDNVTNKSVADVTFSCKGADLATGQHFEYSVDGVKWITTSIDVLAETNQVVIKDLALAGAYGAALPSLLLPTQSPVQDNANVVTTVQLRAADTSGATSSSISQAIVYDHYAAAPGVTRAADNSLLVTGVETDALVQYKVVTQVAVPASEAPLLAPLTTRPTTQPATDDGWSDKAPELKDGTHTVLVRQIDAAGNTSLENGITFTITPEASDTLTVIATPDGISLGSTVAGAIHWPRRAARRRCCRMTPAPARPSARSRSAPRPRSPAASSRLSPPREIP